MDVLVSVIITTHNRSKLLKRSINSVLNQTYKAIEIIIVDDASKDDTSEVVKDFSQKFNNIKYQRNTINQGSNASRNTGINLSSGFFVTGLDDDDEFMPNRIEVLVKNYSDKYSFVTTRNYKVFKNKTLKTKYKKEVNLDTILYSNIVANQILVKREIIINSGLFDETLTRYQDYDMWLRLIQNFGKGLIVNEFTQKIYYDHDVASNNFSKNNFIGAYQFFKKHKKLFNRSQRKFHLFTILRLQEKNISICRLIKFIDLHSYKSILKYLINKYEI